MNEQIIGVAIEDSHISAGVVDFGTRKVTKNSLQRKRVNPLGSVGEIISSWGKVIKDISILNSAEIEKVGIALPGSSGFEEGIFMMNVAGRYNSLYNHNIKELLGVELGIDASNIRMMNVAACFMQGEVFGGSGRGFKSSLGVTLGIGLGTAKYKGGVAENCQLAYTPFLDGIAEEYISVKWLINRYEALSGIAVRDLIELKQLAAEDTRVAKVFEEFAHNLSQFLTSFIRQNNPEIVIIGGFMESFNRFFFDTLTQKMLSNGIKTPILRAILGEQAFIIGAASTWYESTPLHA